MRVLLVLALCGAVLSQDLPKPAVIEVIEREFEAIVHFSPNYRTSADDRVGVDQFPSGVDSYLIEWGPVGQDFPLTIRQVRPVAQMQVLDDVTLYRGRIVYIGKSVDGKSDRRSVPSDVFYFRSSSVAVNVIRNEQTVFFDDFNGDAGDFDERRWNVAFSPCGDEVTANFNVNGQKHMHSQLGSRLRRCPSESLTARARALFDFQDRTGSIFVDIDGPAFPTQQFRLQLSKDANDLTDGVDVTNMVEIVVQNSQIFAEQTDSAGTKRVVPGTEQNLFARGDNTYSTANVRRPWVWKVSQGHFSLDINGKTIFDNVRWIIPLPFTAGHVSMTHRSFHTVKEGVDLITMHSDNFGFDGPAPTQQTLNFRNTHQRRYKRLIEARGVRILRRNDITDFTAARLKFPIGTLPAKGAGALQVVVNGQSFPLPAIRDLSNDPDAHQNIVIDVSAAVGVGLNTISITGDNTVGLWGDAHLELDFECVNPDRAYSPPNSQCIFASNGFPVSFNCNSRLLPRPVLHVGKEHIFERVGDRLQAEITVDIDTGRQLRHAGGSRGIKFIEVMVDCEVTKIITLSGAAFRLDEFKVDVDFPIGLGGIKEVFIRAIDNTGTRISSLLTTDNDGEFVPGDGSTLRERYRPIKVDTATGVGVVSLTLSRACPSNVMFQGGECQDECVFTAGLVEPSVCPAPAQQAAGATGNDEYDGLAGVRALPRQFLFSGWRAKEGLGGDWYEDPNRQEELDTYEDPSAPPFNRTECEAQGGVNCIAADETHKSINAGNPFAAVPNSPKNWIDRDIVPGYALESDVAVVAFLEEQYPEPSETEPSETEPSETGTTTEPSSASAVVMSLSGLFAVVLATCL